jgi:hypothetical protein
MSNWIHQNIKREPPSADRESKRPMAADACGLHRAAQALIADLGMMTYPVPLSANDAARGTFDARHSPRLNGAGRGCEGRIDLP